MDELYEKIYTALDGRDYITAQKIYRDTQRL